MAVNQRVDKTIKLSGSSADKTVQASYEQREGDENGGLNLVYYEGDTCETDNSRQYSIQIKMFCNSNSGEPDISYDSYSLTECRHTIHVSSESACYSFSTNPLTAWL